MRLQLTVQRHGLPPTQVLWVVGGLRPPYAAAGASPTISQLLGQVNEIIPLESEDWGLEDYAVEVRGFECLHFSELSQILKEEDEVSIRPLQTSDLRFRRLSGRHQISADGKHLVDGVAFGRPYLRRGDRPTIKIPPRKRRRLTYGDDEDLSGSEHPNDRQIVLRAGFDNADDESEDASEDDDEYDPDEDQGALDEELRDLSEELQALVDEDEQQSLGVTERALHSDGVGKKRGRLTRSRPSTNGLGLGGDTILDLTDENGRRYPGEYHNPLLDYYDQDELVSGKNAGKKQNRRKKQSQLALDGDLMVDMPANSRRGNRRRRSSSTSTKNVRFEDGQPRPSTTIPEDKDTDESEDEDFQSNCLVDSGSDGSDKENARPDTVDSKPTEVSSTDDESSSTVSSDSDSGDTETSSSLSSSSSSSSSDSESELSVEEQQHNVNVNMHMSDAPNIKAANTGDIVSISKDALVDSARNVAPGQGRKETRVRNQRRRRRKKLAYLKSIGVLPDAATIADLRQWDAAREETAHTLIAHESEELPLKEPNPVAAFEATRQALLDSIASGGVELEPSQPDVQNLSPRAQSVDASAFPDMEELRTAATPAVAQSATETQHAASEPPRRRAKLDLASSKRLLFGSLGLRTPKTKDDEQFLREKLMNNVKPMNNARCDHVDDAAPNHVMDDDSWKDKIILKAVECCHDGIELSTPPFPFVQRWDPQQQGHYTNNINGQGGKNKKRKRNKQHYEEQERAQDGGSDACEAEVLNNHEVDHGNLGNNDSDQVVRHTDSEGYEGAINDQLMRDATGISATAPTKSLDAEDLPALPDDISSCKTLISEETVPGTIFAFKQLDMSQDTGWQPKISDYRTATVNEVMEDGVLQVTLAQRDRPDKVKSYNAQTGKRLYSKFEMPDYEDSDVDNDDGIFEIAFADLIEPKLIQATIAEQTTNVEEQQQPIAVDRVEAGGADVPMPEVDQVLAEGSTGFPAEETNNVLQDVESQEISEAAEKEILKMIKESGFNSDVADGVNNEQGFQSHENPLDPKADEICNDSNSPRFNGFSSSPPEESTSKQVPSTHDGLDGKSGVGSLSNVELSGDVNTRPSGNQSPDDHSLTGDVIDEALLPQLDVDDERFRGHAAKNTSEEADHQLPSQELSTPSSPPRTASEITRSKGRGLRSLTHPRPMSALDGTGSDPDDLPTLETVYFARTRTVKTSTGNPTNNSESQEESPRGKFRSESIAIKSSSPLFENRLAGSQAPVGSQIVDLTLSSDAVDPDDSEYEYKGSELPGGPGWVEKRSTRATKPKTKRSAGKTKRTRSNV